MARDQIDMTPLQSRDELVAWLAAGVKPRSEFRIGTEHEKTRSRSRAVTRCRMKARAASARCWRACSSCSAGSRSWSAATSSGCTTSPGGRRDFARARRAVRIVRRAGRDRCTQTQSELMAHLAQVARFATPLGHRLSRALGMTPSWSRAQIPLMPKGRYKIMSNYMPKVGQYGLDMMYRTCTVQTNLDFCSEADMVKKLRVVGGAAADRDRAVRQFAVHRGPAQRLSVVPLRDLARHRQRPVGDDPLGIRGRHGIRALGRLCARRSHVFRQARRYLYRRVGFVVPRLFRGQEQFVSRRAADAVGLGQSFVDDFPEVRLKRYLEMRGADGVPWGRLPALPAFWVGLLYDDDTLNAAWDLVKHWTAVERQALRDDVPRFGFKARIRDRYLFEIARECLKLSHAGLRRRNRVDHSGRDESRYLEPLERILESGRTPAEEMLEKFNGAWGGSVEPAYTEYAF